MVVVIVLVVDGWNFFFFLSFLPLNGFVVDNYPLGMKFGKLKNTRSTRLKKNKKIFLGAFLRRPEQTKIKENKPMLYSNTAVVL